MGRIAVVGLLLAVAAAFFAAGGHEVVSLANIKAYRAEAERLYAEHPLLTLGAFFLFYLALATTSLPGGAPLTIFAGAVLGVPAAVVLVSFASSIGATLAFLISRYVLHDWVHKRFSTGLSLIDAGMKRDGPLYLFMLRLVPVFPFFLVNVGMGVTGIRTWTYYWVSQLGMLAGTTLFATAGRKLAELESPMDVLSPGILSLLGLLAVLPLLAKEMLRRRRGRGSPDKSGTGSGPDSS